MRYVKEIIIHHCVDCGRITEQTICPTCGKDISDNDVVFKAEIILSAATVEGSMELSSINEKTLDLVRNGQPLKIEGLENTIRVRR